MDKDKTIKWSAHEYEKKHRSVDWYWAIGLIAISSIIISIVYKNYLFAIFIFLGVASIVIFSVRPPSILHFEVGSKGVRIKNILYPYEGLKAFWINPEKRKLLIASNRAFMQVVVIVLPEEHVEEIREKLLNHLPEKEMEEPLSERLTESLGF